MLPARTDKLGDWPATRVLVVDDDVELCELVVKVWLEIASQQPVSPDVRI